jgi:hypothetical protein
VAADTGLVHMAGAKGKAAWVAMASPAPDWRWRRDREDSPWYPTIRLFRQERPGDTLLAEVLIYALATTPGTYTVTLDTGGNTFFDNGGIQVGAEQGYAIGYMGMLTVMPATVPELRSIVTGMTAVLLAAGFQGFRSRIRRPGPVSA